MLLKEAIVNPFDQAIAEESEEESWEDEVLVEDISDDDIFL